MVVRQRALRTLRVPALSDLAVLSTHEANDIVSTVGAAVAGVGGSRYGFIAGDSSTIDNAFVFNSAGAAGRWHEMDKSICNVKKCGARGDGTTDDTAAIQNAVNTGAPVYFPKGVYKISDAIEFGANFTMYGDGGGLSEVKWNTGQASQIMFKNSATVDTLIVRGLKFRHRADSSASFTDGGAVLTNSGKYILIESCQFVDMSTTALELLGTDDAVTRQDCYILNNQAWNETASYYSCNFAKPSGGRNVIFRGNMVRNYSRAISVEMKNDRSFDSVLITDNVIQDSKVANKATTQTAVPIHVSLETGTQNIDSVVIANNIVRQTDGINGTTSANYGIALNCSANTINRAIVKGNLIDTWSGRSSISIPIFLKGVDNPIVSDNIIAGVSWSNPASPYRGMVIQTYLHGECRGNLFVGDDSLTPDTTYSFPIVLVGNLQDIKMDGNYCDGFLVQHQQPPKMVWSTVAAGTATPDVSGMRRGELINLVGSPQTITNFANGHDTQELILWVTNQHTTISNNGNIKLDGGVNFTPGSNGAIITFYNNNGVWREICRTAY